MKWRQAKKIIKKYSGYFRLPCCEFSIWEYDSIPHKSIKQRHIKRWFEGDDDL